MISTKKNDDILCVAQMIKTLSFPRIDIDLNREPLLSFFDWVSINLLL